MGLILDTSLLIAEEKGKFDLPGFLARFPEEEPEISAITASELLHGVERANDEQRKKKRARYVEETLSQFTVLPFALAEARRHARVWAELKSSGRLIGPHDLMIAATALAPNRKLATLNAREFEHVTGLKIVDAKSFLRP
jgi:tRNA(fMet)-specific endonuclease VapC